MVQIYIFHVRSWNIDFFVNLESRLISQREQIKVLWFCMSISESIYLSRLNKEVYYLPDLLSNAVININKIDDFEKYMYDTHGFGINLLYQQERFKPFKSDSNLWIQKHVSVLLSIIPKDAISIALSCDHMVYILSSYINEYYSGRSIFVQPVGFPMNSQVILQSPCSLLKFRSVDLDKKVFTDYKESLNHSPLINVNYLISKKNISLFSSFVKNFKKLSLFRKQINEFSYLDDLSISFFPNRFKAFFRPTYVFNYLKIDDLSFLRLKNEVFYFPLQFEPEMTIFVYSNWFKSQLEVIRLISQSLRFGDILILKENPKMIGEREVDFYKQIEMFPNVFWVDPKENSREIIRISSKVISLTGTAVVEAAFLGINSLLFGFAPFRSLLIDEAIENQKLCNFVDILYLFHTSDAIIQHLESGLYEYSKSIILGNYIPQYIDGKFTLQNADILANDFSNLVLSNIKVPSHV
jgi:hypothetical protein